MAILAEFRGEGSRCQQGGALRLRSVTYVGWIVHEYFDHTKESPVVCETSTPYVLVL